MSRVERWSLYAVLLRISRWRKESEACHASSEPKCQGAMELSAFLVVHVFRLLSAHGQLEVRLSFPSLDPLGNRDDGTPAKEVHATSPIEVLEKSTFYSHSLGVAVLQYVGVQDAATTFDAKIASLLSSRVALANEVRY